MHGRTLVSGFLLRGCNDRYSSAASGRRPRFPPQSGLAAAFRCFGDCPAGACRRGRAVADAIRSECRDLTSRLQGPSSAHWLGTDHLGRDIYSRLIAGAGVSMGAVSITLAIILTMGIVIGGAAGFLGGRSDQIIM